MDEDYEKVIYSGMFKSLPHGTVETQCMQARMLTPASMLIHANSTLDSRRLPLFHALPARKLKQEEGESNHSLWTWRLIFFVIALTAALVLQFIGSTLAPIAHSCVRVCDSRRIES